MTIKSTIIAAAIASAIAAVPAHADTTRTSTQVEVADLDLTTAEGEAALEERMQDAVREMCGSYDRYNGYGERPFRDCVRSVNIEAQAAVLVAEAREAANKTTIELAAK